MKKLDKQQFYKKLKEVEKMAYYKHEDFEVEKLLADLYYTIAEGYLWELPKILWREWKIKQVVKKHKHCCDLTN